MPRLSDGDSQSAIGVPGSSSTGVKTAMSNVELEQKVKDLEAKLKTEKSSNSYWRKTRLLIMYGLLHANLPRTPRDKPVSVSEVKDFLDKVILSRNFAEKTIRSRMPAWSISL